MSNHDAAYRVHQLRGKAQNFRPIHFTVTADDVTALREEGHSDAEIEAAIAMLAPHLERRHAISRHRLPNRRVAITRSIEFVRGDGQAVTYEATIGFDDDTHPREVFLTGAKEGSDRAAELADTAVAISVALQHGVPAEAMAVSIARSDGKPVSVIGAALDLVAQYERERAALVAALPIAMAAE